jgi:hypothetical protein
LRNGVLVELELLKVLFRGCGMRFPVFTLVLALSRDALELFNLRWRGVGVADEFVDVASVTAQIPPSQDPLAAFPILDAKVEGLVEQECFLVTFPSEDIRVRLSVFTLLFGKQLGLSLFVNSLNDELVLKVLRSSPDSGRCVLKDELGVAFRRKWSDEVQLPLWELSHRLLVAGAEEELPDCT